MSRGGYNGGSTLVSSWKFGRNIEDWEVTACSLFGLEAFANSRDFLEYCDVIDCTKAIADSYDAVEDRDLAEGILTMMVAKMIELNSMERGKNRGLLDAIKRTRGYPIEFIERLSSANLPEADPAPSYAPV